MTSKALKIGLATSLALNVFIIGAGVGVLGAQARHAHQMEQATRKKPAPRTPNGANALLRAADALPEARREDYIARLNKEGEIAKADFKAARELRVKASSLIASPKFEAQEVLALLAEARNHDQQSRARFEQAVVEFAAELSPAERKAFGDRISPNHHVDRRKDGEGRNGPGPDGPPPPPKP